MIITMPWHLNLSMKSLITNWIHLLKMKTIVRKQPILFQMKRHPQQILTLRIILKLQRITNMPFLLPLKYRRTNLLKKASNRKLAKTKLLQCHLLNLYKHRLIRKIFLNVLILCIDLMRKTLQPRQESGLKKYVCVSILSV